MVNGMFTSSVSLKTRQGARVLYFHDPIVGGIVVCTCGFAKGAKKVQSNEISVAKSVKSEYERVRAAGEPIRIVVSEGMTEPERRP